MGGHEGRLPPDTKNWEGEKNKSGRDENGKERKKKERRGKERKKKGRKMRKGMVLNFV